MWRRRLRYYTLKFLRQKESPRSVALGFALGACINFLPIFGLGVVVTGFLASLTRLNMTASLLGHLLFTPLFPLLIPLNIFVGHLILDDKVGNVLVVLLDSLKFEPMALADMGKIFFWGAFVNIVVTGFLLTIIVYKLFVSYRKELLCWYLTKRLPRI